jgi:serine/threonine protein kinase
MDQAAAHAVAPPRAVFQDGFGERFRATQPGTSEQIEVLRLRHALTDVLSFEFSLRELMGLLSSFKHTAFGRVRVRRTARDPAPGIALVSDAVPGVRLLDPKGSERRQFGLDINMAGNLIRQVMSAVAMLHANTGGIAHGAIAPERIVVTPKGRVVIVEHVMAGALEERPIQQSGPGESCASPACLRASRRRGSIGGPIAQLRSSLALAIARPLRRWCPGRNRPADDVGRQLWCLG